MVIWAYLNENNGYLTGWTLNKPDSVSENLIEIDLDEYSDMDIQRNFFGCKYDRESKKVIFDEEQYLKILKEHKEYDMRDSIMSKINDGFKININNKNLIFKPNKTNKSFLEQAYYLFTNKIISETVLPFVTESGEEVMERVIDSNIFEVWLLTYINEEDINKKFNNEILPRIRNAKSEEELEKITW